jgi:DNA-binding transcriptional MerR regulator
MFDAIDIPNQSSFKINEVCSLTGIKSYVLRFWESEFVEIKPIISSDGVKFYRQCDIEAILLIKKLLFDDKFSIDRARAEMKKFMPLLHSIKDSYHESFNQNNVEKTEIEDLPISFIESDVEKLMKAKLKLHEILSLTKVLHEKNHWT